MRKPSETRARPTNLAAQDLDAEPLVLFSEPQLRREIEQRLGMGLLSSLRIEECAGGLVWEAMMKGSARAVRGKVTTVTSWNELGELEISSKLEVLAPSGPAHGEPLG